MKPPPTPMAPSGLSPTCPNILGTTLVVQCLPGWGWTQINKGKHEPFEVHTVTKGQIEIIPEAYVEFTTPRCGITGRVPRATAPYQFRRFVAFIMSDGVDFNFTDQIAPAWWVIFGNGNLDLESTWFPILDGDDALFGYGTVGKDAEYLQRSGYLDQPRATTAP